MWFVWTEYYMFGKHVIFPFSSIINMFSVDYIFLLNITYVFAIITCFGFLVTVVIWLTFRSCGPCLILVAHISLRFWAGIDQLMYRFITRKNNNSTFFLIENNTRESWWYPVLSFHPDEDSPSNWLRRQCAALCFCRFFTRELRLSC